MDSVAVRRLRGSHSSLSPPYGQRSWWFLPGALLSPFAFDKLSVALVIVAGAVFLRETMTWGKGIGGILIVDGAILWP